MTGTAKTRIASLDLLKGAIMVIMALDHVRDYFHAPAFLYNPADPVQSTLPIFFTRWITHFCAPTFSFLAGLSAFLVGRRKSKSELSSFLIKRGIWLIIIEITIVNFSWYFDFQFRVIGLLVIWSLGVSMIVLAALIHLPKKMLLIICLLVIGGHNLLDSVNNYGLGWSLLHQQNMISLGANRILFIGYPLIPWIAVMGLGYYFGSFYTTDTAPEKRRKIFNGLGMGAIVLFAILRFTNFYGEPNHYAPSGNISSDLISFFNPSKYPPSLLYVLMTLGGALLVLANTEKSSGRIVEFFSTFGRVPFFYYILHIYLIHLLAMLFAQLSGFGWQKMILSTWVSMQPGLQGYGFNLLTVYGVWALVIVLLYPLCRWFDRYKQNHKEKWWLSYL